MTLYEIVAVIIAVAGLIISIVSLAKARKADKIAQGQIEINLHQMINQTKKDVIDITMLLAEKGSKDKKDMSNILNQALKSAQELNINAFEEACAKYLDGKIDKEHFKKTITSKFGSWLRNTQKNLMLPHPPIKPF